MNLQRLTWVTTDPHVDILAEINKNIAGRQAFPDLTSQTCPDEAMQAIIKVSSRKGEEDLSPEN